jgi:hypothetical protein
VSQIVGTWNLDLRLTEIRVEGNIYGDKSCVADTMRSEIGVSRPYLLTLTDAAHAMLKDLSSNYSADFPIWAEGPKFGDPPIGYFDSEILVVPCSDGPEHRLFPYAGGILGQLSGQELSGTWAMALMDLDDVSPSVHFTATFTGKR